MSSPSSLSEMEPGKSETSIISWSKMNLAVSSVFSILFSKWSEYDEVEPLATHFHMALNFF